MSQQLARANSADYLKRRIQLNQKAQFGLQTATPQQLNIIYLLCQRLDLDPLTDLTIIHGRPWLTIDGCLRLMRRHPEYAGFRQWPLAVEDKLQGGWAEDDIVWATEIRTKAWGEIVQWGKVTQAEVMEGQRTRAPIGQHPVEMAQKRSAQRAIRAAFGHDAAPDEAEMEQLIVEEIETRSDPATTQRLAATYDAVYGDQDAEPDPSPPEPDPDQAAARAWDRNRKLTALAERLKVKAPVLGVGLSAEEIESANDELEAQLAERQVPR